MIEQKSNFDAEEFYFPRLINRNVPKQTIKRIFSRLIFLISSYYKQGFDLIKDGFC